MVKCNAYLTFQRSLLKQFGNWHQCQTIWIRSEDKGLRNWLEWNYTEVSYSIISIRCSAITWFKTKEQFLNLDMVDFNVWFYFDASWKDSTPDLRYPQINNKQFPPILKLQRSPSHHIYTHTCKISQEIISFLTLVKIKTWMKSQRCWFYCMVS